MQFSQHATPERRDDRALGFFYFVSSSTMNGNTDSHRSCARVYALHRARDARLQASRPDEVGRRILANQALVLTILESASSLGTPIAIDAFKAWLEHLGTVG